MVSHDEVSRGCSEVLCVFFFKQKTAYEMRISDWSSDVCSSDLTIIDAKVEPIRNLHWTSRHTRIAVLLVVAVIVSIAIAVVVQLVSTGRLDLAMLTGAASSSSPAQPTSAQTMPVPDRKSVV